MRLFSSLMVVIIFSAAMLLACTAKDSQQSASASQTGAASQSPSPAQTSPSAPQEPASQTAAQATPGDGARRITREELQEDLKNNKAIVIDVRSDLSYKAGHIKGARNIMASDIAAHISELPKDKLIVLYCS